MNVASEFPVAPDASELPPPPAEWVDVYYKRYDVPKPLNLTKMLIALENNTADAEKVMADFKQYLWGFSTLPPDFRRWKLFAIDRIKRMITGKLIC